MALLKLQGASGPLNWELPVTDDLDVYTVWVVWWRADSSNASLATTATPVFPQYSLRR